jgi:hypothetical protein
LTYTVKYDSIYLGRDTSAMALTGSERSAISRALARGGAAAVRRVRYGLYRVASSSRPGVVHTVGVDAAGRGTPVYRCDCEAGVAGRVCWHAAAVFVAKVEHASGARVTGPGRRPAALPNRQGPAGRGETAATVAPAQPHSPPVAA